MKKLVVIVALIATAMTVYAQSDESGSSKALVNDLKNYNRISFSLASFSARRANGAASPFGKDAMRMPGFKLGWTGGYSVGSRLPFFIETGVDLQYNTRRGEENDDYDLRASTMGLVIPVNLGYKLIFKNGAYIEPYCGIHFKLNLAGKYKLIVDTEINEDAEEDNTTKLEDKSASWWSEKHMREEIGINNSKGFNRFQLGWQVGVNVGYKKFNFNLAYVPESLRLWGRTTVGIDEPLPIAIFDSHDVKSGSIVMGIGINL